MEDKNNGTLTRDSDRGVGMLSSVNLLDELEKIKDFWSPRVVGQVNSQYVKVAKLRGELVWHKHDDEDELFQVVRGSLRIQLQGRPELIIKKGEFAVVPRGTMHNPVADDECWIVLVETVTTRHTGDAMTSRTKSLEEQLGPSDRGARR